MSFNKINIKNSFYLFITTHLIVWTLIPTLTNDNLPLDTIEALAWGSNLEWGFDKHPPASAFFSEIFYPYGWKVYVNGTETNFDNVNVALRGLYLNKCNNTIECYFSPDVVNKSSYVSLGSSLLLFLLMMSSLFYNIKNRS